MCDNGTVTKLRKRSFARLKVSNKAVFPKLCDAYRSGARNKEENASKGNYQLMELPI